MQLIPSPGKQVTEFPMKKETKTTSNDEILPSPVNMTFRSRRIKQVEIYPKKIILKILKLIFKA